MAEEAKGECGVAEVAAVVEAGMDHLGEISIRAIKETVETGVAINGLTVEAMEIGETMVAMAATTVEVGTTILKADGEIRAMAEAMVETDQATMAIWATATVDGEVPAEAMAEAMAAMEEDLLWMLEDMIKATVVDLCAKIQGVTVVESGMGMGGYRSSPYGSGSDGGGRGGGFRGRGGHRGGGGGGRGNGYGNR